MKLTNKQQFWKQIFNEAESNQNFKKELIANPVNAIKNLTGKKIDLPEGKSLKIVDQSDNSFVYIILPNTNSNELDIELSEEELEHVAGGSSKLDCKPWITPNLPNAL